MSHVYRDEWPEKYSITLGNGHKFHWISRGKKDSRRSIYCLLCNTEFSAAHAGAGAITQHIKGKKHTEKAENKKNSVRLEVSNNAKEVEKDAEPEAGPSNTMTGFLSSEAVTRAEIIWTLQGVRTHLSYRSTASSATIFKDMFPDSAIASQVQLGKDKVAYGNNYGLSPFYEQEFVSKIMLFLSYVRVSKIVVISKMFKKWMRMSRRLFLCFC